MSIGVVFGCVSGYFDNYLNNKLQNFMHILSKITAISQEILEKKIWFAGNGKKNATLVETYMCSGENSRMDAMVHLSTPKSRKKRFDQSKFYTFFGWEDGFM